MFRGEKCRVDEKKRKKAGKAFVRQLKTMYKQNSLVENREHGRRDGVTGR